MPSPVSAIGGIESPLPLPVGHDGSSNNVTIDGISVENTNGNGANTFVNMDSVATVKILVSNFQAEFGRKPGAGM